MESSTRGGLRETEVLIPAGRVSLPGILAQPSPAVGVVLFAHGSGSGRFSPRNAFVAGQLHSVGLGTLLLDLLTEDEAGDRRLVFDIDLLADRLLAATDWLDGRSGMDGLGMGYFGASTGAAAALQAAARSSREIAAVVSRGGRPDLAMAYLPRVKAPTLLLVGGRDEAVLGLNQQAYAVLATDKELVVVPGASHLFEEPGTLEHVARLAGDWFTRWLTLSS